MLGGVEAGGTKFVCLLGTGPDNISETAWIDVTGPTETVGAAVEFFRRATASGVELEAIGIASFGPVELRRNRPDYGRITQTPKRGWSDTDIVGSFAASLGVPVGFDTDVSAAALAEGRLGAARGSSSFVYMTLGTGIGGGAVRDGEPLHGLVHPEMGHVTVPRRAGDHFVGLCPFHGDCLEGMMSGPAIRARYGRRAEFLAGDDQQAAAQLAGFYLAAGIKSIAYVLAPERIVVGGGLSQLPGLLATARAELPNHLKGYPGLPDHEQSAFIVPAHLKGMAGPAGALILAERALEQERPGSVEQPASTRLD